MAIYTQAAMSWEARSKNLVLNIATIQPKEKWFLRLWSFRLSCNLPNIYQQLSQEISAGDVQYKVAKHTLILPRKLLLFILSSEPFLTT